MIDLVPMALNKHGGCVVCGVIPDKICAHIDYTRAVISERDQYMDNTIWQANRIAELKEANSSLAGASIVPGDMVLISRKELAELRLQVISDIGQEIDAEPVAWLSYGDVSTKRSDFGHAQVIPLYAAPDGLRKAAQQALYALEDSISVPSYFGHPTQVAAANALRKELK